MEIAIRATAPAAGRLVWAGREVVCTLGHGGIRADKREGDGATPAGLFTLRRVLWRADRLADPPVTRLPCAPILPTDGWCDWPEDPLYNRPVTLPYPARHERMWRDDALYDIVGVIGYNDSPAVSGLGSAIFLHVAGPDYAPTEGCVALAIDDLIRVLADCDETTTITIGD